MKFFVELKITLEKLRYISYNRSGNGRRLWEVKKGYMQFQVEFYETVDGKYRFGIIWILLNQK